MYMSEEIFVYPESADSFCQTFMCSLELLVDEVHDDWGDPESSGDVTGSDEGLVGNSLVSLLLVLGQWLTSAVHDLI